MDLQNAFVILSLAINITLFLVVYFRVPHTKTNITFEATIFAIVGWCLSMFLFRATPILNAIILAKLLYLFPIFIPIGFFLFGLYFPNFKVRKLILAELVILCLLLSFLTLFSNGIINSISLSGNNEKIIHFGWAYLVYLIYIPVAFTASFVVLYLKMSSASPLVKNQIRFFLTGLIVASLPAMLTNLILPTYGYFDFNWLGQVFTTFWVVAVAYAIIKHRFLDIRLIVARMIAYTLLLTTLGLFYSGSIFLISRLFFTEIVSGVQIIIYSILALFVAITSQPLKNILEKTTDKIFFKNKYSTAEILSRLTSTMATSIQLEDVTQKTLTILLETMHVNSGVFYVFHNNHIYKMINNNWSNTQISQSHIGWLASCTKVTILEEEQDTRTKQLMTDLGITIILPLATENTQQGVLLLSEKKSGEMYSQQDIKVLEIFGSEVAIAIQNAKSYDEINQFNITLKEEVEKATRDLQRANDRLQQLDKVKDEFVSIASHELRTPMTIIKNYLWMLEYDKNSKLDAKQKEYVDRAYASTDRLIGLVNDMLNVSRIESGRMTMDFAPSDIKKVAEDVVKEMSTQAEAQKIHLFVRGPSEPIQQVYADPNRIKEVIINFIGNSFKFTPAGGEIKVVIEPSETDVTVRVVDTGKGIKPEDMDKLFKKFSIVGSQYLRKLNSQGTGLGLYLSKSIIELHKGKIWAESAGENKGATFSFTLPYVSVMMIQPEQAPAAEPSISAQSGSTLRA